MKVSKDAKRTARKLFDATVSKDGAVDADLFRRVVKKLNESKPRGYLGVINAYWQLVRLELQKNHAVIESAVELSDSMKKDVADDLKSKYGNQITTEYSVNPDLLGGMRIKVGSDVWDGSVRERLNRLENTFK